MSEFEKILKVTNEARDKGVDLNEYVKSISNVIGAKIKAILAEHQKDIMAVDESFRAKIKENVKGILEKSLDEVEDYPKGASL